MPLVKRSLKAQEDLIEIWEYIRLYNPDAADKTLRDIQKTSEHLSYFPHSAPLREEFGPHVRCRPVKNYVLLYRPIPDGILLLRIVHSARYLPGLL